MKITRSALPFILALLFSCGSDKGGDTEIIVNDSRFGEYILSHTDGLISKKDNISVRFSENVNLPADLELNELFDIDPSFRGSIVKTDAHTIVVAPENQLASGKKYLFKLKLNTLVDVPEELNEFLFRVEIIEQDFTVEVNTIQTPDPSQPNLIEFDGLVTTADFEENEAIEKMIQIDEGVTINWQHMSATTHRFAVSGLQRSEKDRTLLVRGSGKPIGLSKVVDLNVTIPSIEAFSVISTRVDISDNPLLSIFFSDPLDASQKLDGLIRLEGMDDPRLVINGNELKVYVAPNTTGTKKLEIFEGIRNSGGKTLGEPQVRYVAFEPEKPQIKLLGNGTILPSTQGLVLPFEAVNLKAVQVEVIKIFEDSLPQFFQTNSVNGDSQLKRVGQRIISKKISLEEKAGSLSIWNRFTLDLATLFESERGALYQIRIGFRPEDTNFPCSTPMETDPNEVEQRESWSIHQDDGFDEWGNLWEYRYPKGYQWEQRENPCDVSYYTSNRFATTSLLATDLGLIAKIGGDNKLLVYTTNMVTAQPIEANVKVFDFQLRELANGVTDAIGNIVFQPERRPFLIIAESNGQKSYLKLADNESLSMSNFDVSGTRVEGNLKGFAYGERGVWRPGNNIYLSFMLEDPDQKIPADHPIVMELHDPRGNVKDRQVKTNGINGLYTFQTKTEPDDLTGNWWATFSVGNNEFVKTVKIETIKPNRLKIDLDLGVEKITYLNRSLTGKLHANWLTGLTAGNLKAET